MLHLGPTLWTARCAIKQSVEALSDAALTSTKNAAKDMPLFSDRFWTGWTREQLQALFAAANLTPKQALRTSKSPAEKLGLTDPAVSDEAILDAMLEHPVLVNRPIVCTEKGVALCRPSEVVFSLLEVVPGTTFIKEDGEVVTAP